MERTAKKITAPALALWSAGMLALIGFQVALTKWPELKALRHLGTLAALLTIPGMSLLMRDVPRHQVSVSPRNSRSRNLINGANIGGGLLMIVAAMALLGFFSPVLPGSPGFAICVGVMALYLLMQIAIILIPDP
jgi:hypothetical protein